jgi:hypothetical protein
MLARTSALTFLALLGAAQAAPAIHLAKGDLLVLDATNQKVLRVDVETGAVDDFSPRDGGGNLIDTPRGIAASPEGDVYVTNYADGALVKIDPASGAQSIVEFYWGGVGGPLDLGTHPAGVDVSVEAPAGGDQRDVYVSSRGALYRVDQSLFGTTSTSFPYPQGYENTEGVHLSFGSGGAIVQAFIDAPPSLLEYQPGSNVSVEFADIFYPVLGMEMLRGSNYLRLFLSIFFDPFPCGYGGSGEVQEHYGWYQPVSYASGAGFSCPGALTATPSEILPFSFYLIDQSTAPPRILAFDTGGTPPPTTVVATLPGGASYPDLTVYAPEPGDPWAGGIALAGLGAALRRRRLMREAGRSEGPASA